MPAAKKTQQITYNVGIALTEAEADKAKGLSGEDSVALATQMLASDSVGKVLNGGLLLDSGTTDRIQEALGSTDPDKIASAVEKSVGRIGRHRHVSVLIDPCYEPYWEDRSKQTGQSIEQILQNLVNEIIDSGWLYTVPDNIQTIRIPEKHLRELEGIIGEKNLTGEEVVNYVRGLSIERQREQVA